MKKNDKKILFMAVLGALIFLGYQNCSGVVFTAPNTANSAAGSTGGTASTIRQFQPALAVRDISCLACHANIQANTITDFGLGSPWFMNNFQDATDFGDYHYMATTWQTLKDINGQVIVPETTLPASYVAAQLQSGATAPTSPVSLASYLQLTTMADFALAGGWYSYFGESQPATTSFTNNVNPGSEISPVAAQSSVYIGAPTTQEILAIVSSNTAGGPWVQTVGASSSGLSGLSVVTGVSSQQYVTNSGAISCSGQDVVINGTLLLNSAQIYAEKGGCRLYVTGSVFVEGPITYLNSGSTPDPTDNLQITSSTAIIMGVGLNGEAISGGGQPDGAGETPLEVRLLSDVRGNMLLRSANTTSAYTTYATSIMNEATNIGVTLLQDASVPGPLPVANSAAGQPRASINFQHILLNAPLIHSRYMGTVNGVIVSESAIFSLGEFSFNYDPVFASVPVLPALPFDILCTSSNCTPASL